MGKRADDHGGAGSGGGGGRQTWHLCHALQSVSFALHTGKTRLLRRGHRCPDHLSVGGQPGDGCHCFRAGWLQLEAGYMLFRDFEDVMTWVLTLALTGLALVGAYFILVEIVTIVREIARQIAIASQGRNPGEIAVPPEKRVKPYRDRRTVN